MRLFGKTNIEFLGIRRQMYALSGILIFAGIISLILKGVDYGIDFRGGTELVLRFEQSPDIGEVRAALGKIGLANSEIKSFGGEGELLIRTTEQAEGTIIADKIRTSLTQALPNLPFEVRKGYTIGPKIGKELRKDALYAIVASLAVILGYIGLRFKFIYGVGAVLALFHDVLITLGVLSILDGVFPRLNLEISQEVVAAFLTLVGVSVNDTVVVFDRIRENTKIYRSVPLLEVMNKSLNETLSRTIITSGTIFVVLATLLIFGGEVTRGFAFTLTVGIVTGTYSSIYIASAVVVDWGNRALKKKPA